MSYYTNEANPYGLDLDAHGQPLNTARNFQILEDIERQRMAPAQHYGGQQVYGAGVPYHGGYDQGFNQGSAYPRDNYYPEQHYSSRESARHVYKENRGAVPTGGSYYREKNTDYNQDRFRSNGGTAVPNRYVDDEPKRHDYPKVDNDYIEPIPTKKVNIVRKEDREVRIPIPHNGIYHWTLLPKGLKEERVVTISKTLSKFEKLINGEKVTISNVGDYYISSIIKTEENAVNPVEDKFSENLFKEHLNSQKEVEKLEIIDIKNDTIPNIVTSFSNNHLVNRLLQEITRTPNFNNEKTYVFDYINATRYFSSKSVNLFVDAAEKCNSFSDIVNALPGIFDKYAENETNINSLLTIDAELTRDFLVFIRGFTGNENIKLQSFMNSVGRLYSAADTYVDMTAQRNIKTGIERFTNILFLNMRKLKSEMEGDLSGIYVPRKELSIITKNGKIREELAVLKEKNDARFYLVDDGYTPELARLIETVDAEKIISGYTKTTLYTIHGLYQIVKTKGKGYYIALIDIYKI